MIASTNHIIQTLIVTFVLLITAPTFAGKIIYVDDDANGANDGSSWTDAFNYLQDALAAANDGDEIRVAQGTYKPDQGAGITPGDRTVTFQLINGVTIKGGYAGFPALDPNARDIELYETILSGDLAGDDEPNFTNNNENSYHVVTGSGIDETTVLDGCIVTAGNANGPYANGIDYSDGGGMYNDNGCPTLTNCTFRFNTASNLNHGGAMANKYSKPTLTGCIFIGNQAEIGGAIYNYVSQVTLTDCTFIENSARSGGAIVGHGDLELTNCKFIRNSASDYGGAINATAMTLNNCLFSENNADYGGAIGVADRSYATLTDCTFSSNSANNGGAIWMFDAGEGPTLTNCTFTENSAYMGGGIHNSSYSSPTLINCTLTANSAGSRGGGMFNHNDSSPTLNNCTFAQNTALRGGAMYNNGRYGSCNPVINNCTFNNNSADDDGGAIVNSYSSPTLTNCTFSANFADGRGGGMYGSVGDLLLKNCVFSGNSAGGGGCMDNSFNSLVLKNCLFTGNSAKNTGGLRNFNNHLFLTNCTFAGNSMGIISSSHHCIVDITSCILWGNAGPPISAIDEVVVTVNYSDMQGGWPGTGNIDTDPYFAEPGYWAHENDPNIIVEPNDPNAIWIDGDYHLFTGSPCIDAGDPNYIAGPNETDLDGKTRVIGGRIDMGSYEYEYGQLIPAEARIVPRTINLASKGNWITCYIWLPDGYDVADIDPNSIRLEDEIKPESLKVDEEQQVAIARFYREDAQTTLEVGDINLKITGRLIDGTVFEATDTIKVIDKAGKN